MPSEIAIETRSKTCLVNCTKRNGTNGFSYDTKPLPPSNRQTARFIKVHSCLHQELRFFKYFVGHIELPMYRISSNRTTCGSIFQPPLWGVVLFFNPPCGVWFYFSTPLVGCGSIFQPPLWGVVLLEGVVLFFNPPCGVWFY